MRICSPNFPKYQILASSFPRAFYFHLKKNFVLISLTKYSVPSFIKVPRENRVTSLMTPTTPLGLSTPGKQGALACRAAQHLRDCWTATSS